MLKFMRSMQRVLQSRDKIHRFIKILENITSFRWKCLLEFCYPAFPFKTFALKYAPNSAITRKHTRIQPSASDKIITLPVARTTIAYLFVYFISPMIASAVLRSGHDKQTEFLRTYVGRSIYFCSRCYHCDFNFLNFAISCVSFNFAH